MEWIQIQLQIHIRLDGALCMRQSARQMKIKTPAEKMFTYTLTNFQSIALQAV